MGRYFLLAWIVLAAPVTATAQPSVVFASSVSRVSVLELYTSEGCSSCPPAERWFDQLRRDPRLWRKLVPVAFHVDYWDQLGWRDRFAQSIFSRRQRRYAASGALSQVYTPGFVLNGREWTDWFHNRALALPEGVRVGRLSLKVSKGRVAAEFTPTARMANRLTIQVAVLGFDIRSRIAAGENAGRTLKHDFVTLGYASTRLINQGASYQARLPLPPVNRPVPRRAIAAWISAGGNPTPLQAIGGWLPNAAP